MRLLWLTWRTCSQCNYLMLKGIQNTWTPFKPPPSEKWEVAAMYMYIMDIGYQQLLTAVVWWQYSLNEHCSPYLPSFFPKGSSYLTPTHQPGLKSVWPGMNQDDNNIQPEFFSSPTSSGSINILRSGDLAEIVLRPNSPRGLWQNVKQKWSKIILMSSRARNLIIRLILYFCPPWRINLC